MMSIRDRQLKISTNGQRFELPWTLFKCWELWLYRRNTKCLRSGHRPHRLVTIIARNDPNSYNKDLGHYMRWLLPIPMPQTIKFDHKNKQQIIAIRNRTKESKQIDRNCCMFLWFGLVLWCLTPLSTIFQLYLERSVLLVEDTGGPGEKHRPVASHWQSLSHNVVHLALIEIRTHNISYDGHWLHRQFVNLNTSSGNKDNLFMIQEKKIKAINIWYSKVNSNSNGIPLYLVVICCSQCMIYL